ncbi:GNAT family N-acetyltransferase [Luteolibacter marinus]|uniref:GNAT family N-acetyltransferase n=1 Tax=Luteolibacter marinus TaxID=2776705 RepID=UPI001865D7B7|nr:GNAT family N-acetyltransferase [Luteolibacter marinus]
MKLTTDRLILKPPAEEDIDAIVAVASDWRIAEMTLVPHPYLPNHAQEWIGRARENWETNGIGGFAVFTRHDGAFIGAAGLRLTETAGHASAGYWYSPRVWGRGYAPEALSALLRFGFEDRGLARIEANHLLINPASGRVMAKAGMSHATAVELPHRDGEGMVAGFSLHIDAAEWRALQSSRLSA